jgi:hypothetical protein
MSEPVNIEDFSRIMRETKERAEAERAAFENLPLNEQRDRIIPKIIRRDIRQDDESNDAADPAAEYRDSQYSRLLSELIDDGIGRKMSVSEAGYEAANVLRGIKGAVIGGDTDPWKQVNFWHHISDAAKLVRAGDIPRLDRESIETAAARYLKSPLRSQQVDRLLVDLLVAQEYFAYAAHVRYAPFGHRRHPLVAYLRGRVWSMALCAVLTGIAFWIGRSMSIPDIWEAAIMLGGIGLFCLDTIGATIGLIVALVARARGRGHATSTDLLVLMGDVYQGLKSAGLISATHILSKVKASDEQGVGWPATLYPLLDDIVGRTARF